MKLVVTTLLFLAFGFYSNAQNNEPSISLDDVSPGEIYELGQGKLTLKHLPNCNITSYFIELPNEQLGGMTIPLKESTLDKISALPSGSKFTIHVQTGCDDGQRIKLSGEFIAP